MYHFCFYVGHGPCSRNGLKVLVAIANSGFSEDWPHEELGRSDSSRIDHDAQSARSGTYRASSRKEEVGSLCEHRFVGDVDF